jgi:hypothetical protein
MFIFAPPSTYGRKGALSAIVIPSGLQWPCYALDEKPIRHSIHFTAEPTANPKGTWEQGIKGLLLDDFPCPFVSGKLDL